MTYAVAICPHGRRVAACPLEAGEMGLAGRVTDWIHRQPDSFELEELEDVTAVATEYCPDCCIAAGGKDEVVVR